jgi:Ca2+-transporting ATPase
MAFFALVASISALILANRTATRGRGGHRPQNTAGNPVLTGILMTVGLALAVSQLWPTATRLLHFERLETGMTALALGTGVLLLLVTELAKPRAPTKRPDPPTGPRNPPDFPCSARN